MSKSRREELLDLLERETPYTDEEIIDALHECACEHVEITAWGDRWPHHICGRRLDADQAVAVEREAISAFLERVANYATHPMIGEGGEWRRVVSDIELRAIAQAIRNGDHHKP